jgi:hypothetical protein
LLNKITFIFSVWHILMAGSLLFLVPRCRGSGKSWIPDEPVVDSGEVNDGASLSENSSQQSVTSRGIPSTESSETVSTDVQSTEANQERRTTTDVNTNV